MQNNNEGYQIPIEEELYAQALGQEILKYLKAYDSSSLITKIESDAVSLLKEIQSILENDTLNDEECFYRIDDIVQSFHKHGISISRHDI